MKPLAYIIALLQLQVAMVAQVNLVKDPSFEIHDTCDADLWIEGCKYWHSLDSNSNNISTPWICTPTYANRCATDPNASLPDNYASGGLSYLYPRSGNGLYILLHHLSPSINSGYNRDYLRGRLIEKLTAGKQYCGKYYVSLYQTVMYGVDRSGAYLDDGSLDQNNNCLPIVKTPYFENPAFNYLTDTTGWTKIEGVFTANGTEQFITIGNFYSHANTHKVVFNPSVFARLDTYYYIDDVSIIPIEISAFAGNDATVCVGDSIELGRRQEIGLECEWYEPGNSTPFSASASFVFKANQTGSFSFIQKMNNCQITSDTVTITVLEDCNDALTVPNTFTPNNDEANDVWMVSLKKATNVELVIYNRWGNIVFSQPGVNNHSVLRWDGRTTSGEMVTEGVYYYTLKYTDSKGKNTSKNGYISLFR